MRPYARQAGQHSFSEKKDSTVKLNAHPVCTFGGGHTVVFLLFPPQQLPVMRPRLSLLLLIGLLLCATPAVAQSENIRTVEGPNNGETTTLTARPHLLADGLSARALGISAPDSTRWALRLIGASETDQIRLLRADETLPILHIDRPADDEIGPTSVYIGQETFLLMAETATVTLQVGDTRASLPDDLRAEMQRIFEKVTGP